MLNETHDPTLECWVSSANTKGTDFPIQNLPFCVFRRKNTTEQYRGGVAIGQHIIDLSSAVPHLDGLAKKGAEFASLPTLNQFMASGRPTWSALRLALSRMLRAGSKKTLEGTLVDQSEAEFSVPAQVRDYTDFYTSIYHATAVGALFRPDNPLLPNYKWIPIAYHGRSSTIRVSGEPVIRPRGQLKLPESDLPVVEPCCRLDYELELGIYVGSVNDKGGTISMMDAEHCLFGVSLLNDWSARDIQAWEYQPLGPFLSKSFATTVSPWVVTMEALEPFRFAFSRPAGDPEPLAYLDSQYNRQSGAIDISLQATIQTSEMRTRNESHAAVSQSSYRHAYWTAAQMLVHHASNGCAMQSGDLLGTGTQSGPTPEEAGSLLELTCGGKKAINIGNDKRTFLLDGDSVSLRAWCDGRGKKRIGFGSAEATIFGTDVPAKQL